MSSAGSNAYLAPAKLNLFLNVVGRRDDGYHLLQTVFVFLEFGDSIYCNVRNDGLIRRLSGSADVPEEEDLVIRAAHLLKRTTGTPLGAELSVHKQIPLGSGLGGGSSDAATTLLVLNQLWKTGLSRWQLQSLGLTLGADVPVFLFGLSAFAEGVGERLQAVDLPPFWALVLCPPVKVATQAVFASPNLTRNSIPLKIADFSGLGLLSVCAGQRNSLEDVVLGQSDIVARHLEALEQISEKSLLAIGGKRARMTGSGACVFALFSTRGEAESAQQRLPEGMKGFVARGLNRHPLFDFAR